MNWENLLGYIFSYLYTQYKVAKRLIFTVALQKDKSNPGRPFLMLPFCTPSLLLFYQHSPVPQKLKFLVATQFHV